MGLAKSPGAKHSEPNPQGLGWGLAPAEDAACGVGEMGKVEGSGVSRPHNCTTSFHPEKLSKVTAVYKNRYFFGPP